MVVVVVVVTLLPGKGEDGVRNRILGWIPHLGQRPPEYCIFSFLDVILGRGGGVLQVESLVLGSNVCSLTFVFYTSARGATGSRDLSMGTSAAHIAAQQQQQGHSHQLSRQLSSIAELLLQQQQQQQGASAAQHMGLSASGASTAAESSAGQQQQQQQQQHHNQQHQQQPVCIRPLPPGFGPWPKAVAESAAVDTAATTSSNSNAQDHEPSSSSSSSGGGVQAQAGGDGGGGVGGASPFAAAASAAAVCDRVLLLRCLLVYHLQASLVYDAQVRAGQICIFIYHM